MRDSRIWPGRLLQPFRSHTCDRRCLGHAGRGNQPRCEQSSPGGARCDENRNEPLIQGNPVGHSSKEVRPPGEARVEGNFETGGTGFGRSGSCSWIVEIAGVGNGLPPCPAKAGREVPVNEARRSGLARLPSFDEAAVEAGLVVLARGVRQRASAADERPSRWPKRPRRGSAARKVLDQEPTGSSGAGLLGKPGDIESHAKARGSPSSEALPEVTSSAGFRPGRRLWKPSWKAKADHGGDSGIERFTGCSCCDVGCTRWVDVSFPSE